MYFKFDHVVDFFTKSRVTIVNLKLCDKFGTKVIMNLYRINLSHCSISKVFSVTYIYIILAILFDIIASRLLIDVVNFLELANITV